VTIEAALAFLGLGDPNRLSWGSMLFFANARNAILTDAWLWWILPPGLGLTVAVLGFAFVGYAIEERADPRLARRVARSARRGSSRPRRAAASPLEARGEAGGPLLEITDLTVGYATPAGFATAVDGVSLALPRGRVTGLVGESGCGKTTLLLALMGLLPANGRVDGGAATLGGRDLLGPEGVLRAVRGRELALVPQSAMNTLNPVYNVHRQVAEACALTRTHDTARSHAAELLALVGIPDERHRAYPHELSGGMRQRVVIAMALANDPALLLADEPTTGLDVVTQAALLRLLLDLQQRRGLTLLLISHDLDLVAKVADRLLVMDDGRIVEAGPARAVTSAPTHPCTRRLVTSTPTLRGPRQLPARTTAVGARAILDIRGVDKTYPGRGLLGRVRPVMALQGVSLTIAEGEILGLVGESGSGKSTLGRAVIGLERPDAGQVLVGDADVAAMGRRELRTARRWMHLVLQDPYQSLHPGMRVAEAVAEPLVVTGHHPSTLETRVTAALEEVGLHADLRERLPHELSGGQRQRVAFARALIGQPRLIVADEPTSMLDVSLQASVLQLVAELRDRHGIAFLFITHDLAVARSIADRVAVLHEGRVVECGPADAVISTPEHPYTATLVAAANDPTTVTTGE
jgi:ABC-type glutathione transport system ATPase component